VTDLIQRLRDCETPETDPNLPDEAADALEAKDCALAEATECLWCVYEAIYGHRKAEGIDPWGTAARGTLAVVKHRDTLAADNAALRKRLGEAERIVREFLLSDDGSDDPFLNDCRAFVWAAALTPAKEDKHE